MWTFWLACRGDDPTDGEPPPGSGFVEVDVVEVEPLVEHLLDDPIDGAIPVGDGLMWTVGEHRAIRTATGEPSDLGDGALPVHAADAGGQVFALLDDEVLAWVGEDLVDAGFETFLDGAARAVVADGRSLWIESASGLFRWRTDGVAELLVDGAHTSGLVAPDAAGGTVWVADGDTVFGFAVNAAFVEGFEARAFAADIDAVAVVDGTTLVVEGGRLWARDGQWTEIRGPEPVFGLIGGPQGAWLRTETGVVFWRPDAWWAPTRAPSTDGRWFADALGRLIVRGRAGVDRWTLHRPLSIRGIVAQDHVATPISVVIEATGADVQSVTAELQTDLGDPVQLDVVDGRVALDPATMPVGRVALWATATYPDQVATASVPFVVDLVGDVTWSRHVEPIHVARCARCHEDSSNTVLDGASSWQDTIGPILDNVRSGAMPLSGDPLTDAQIGLIEAWRDAGFPN